MKNVMLALLALASISYLLASGKSSSASQHARVADGTTLPPGYQAVAVGVW